MEWVAVVVRPRPEIDTDQGLLSTASPLVSGAAIRARLLWHENGQSIAEYGLILALVVLVAVAGLSAFGTGLGTLMLTTFAAVVGML